MATHFVPTEEIRKLTHGSFEHRAHRIDQALESDVTGLFKDKSCVRRIAVFEDHALVATESGEFSKVTYGVSPDGSINLLKAAPVEVPVYTEEHVGDYVFEEAKDIATRFLRGDRGFALDKLFALVPYIESERPLPEPELVENSLKVLHLERPWKKLYQERADAISDFLGDALKDIKSKRITAKYEELLKGGDKPEQHHELVVGDLSFMSESLGKMLEAVEKARDVSDVEAKVKSLGEESILKSFVSFSEDLMNDLRHAKRLAQESTKSIKSVALLGKLYDALAEESFHYEVASRFVSMMSEKLRE